MLNNVVLFGKISQKKINQLFNSANVERFSPQLRKLISDNKVGVRVEQDFVELHRGAIGKDELSEAINQIFEFCDEITIIPNGRAEEAEKQPEQPKSEGLELELMGE